MTTQDPRHRSRTPLGAGSPAAPPPERTVSYVDLPGWHAPLRDEILAAVGRVLDHGHFILGPEIAEFDRRFAEVCGTRHAVGVSSGTDALLLALKALGIGPGDEVITAPNSFVATASAVALLGARPVLVDVAEDYNIDASKLEAAVTTRTKAVLPVHLTGRPADMRPILDLAEDRGLHVVEDAAQAIFAEYRGQRVGSFGAAGCFSFHPVKTLNACGDGGAITTNDSTLHERLVRLRNIGLRTRDECATWSGNHRLDALQAAIVLAKLPHAVHWTESRRQNAAYYAKALAGLPGLQIPSDKPHEWAVYHTFVVQSERRDALKEHLARRGVGSAIHYPIPIHLQPAAAELGYRRGDFPVAERQAARILSLPVHHGLVEEDLEYVVRCVQEFHA